MTLEEILNKVDKFVPNSESTETKVDFLNEIQRELFRDFPVPREVKRFETTPNLEYYEYPEDCPPDRIDVIYIDGQQFELASEESHEPMFYWMPVDDKHFFINPAPDNKVDGFILYAPRPNTLSAGNTGETPNFPEDYHMLLVFKCCNWIAKVQRDVDLANNFQLEFNELARRAKRDLRRAKAKTVRITQDWR